MNIRHSPATYSQGNGLAEASVKISKNKLMKSKDAD
jgi:hypothetical protein